MPIHMVCSCGQVMVAADEHVGLKVRCPKCQGIIIVPGERLVPALPVAARRDLDLPEAEEEFAPRAAVSKREGLRRARIGLGLHWGKYLCFLILWAFALLA